MLSFFRKIINKNVVLSDIKIFLVFRIKEILFSKKSGSLSKVILDFPKNIDFPELDARFLNSDINHSFSFNGSAIDVIDFKERRTERFLTAAPRLSKTILLCRKKVKRSDMPKGLSYASYFDAHKITPHTCHLSPQGYLCATNKYYIYVIDTKKDKLHLLPDSFHKGLMLYCDTGGFSPDYKYWYFVRWPYEDTIAIKKRKKGKSQV